MKRFIGSNMVLSSAMVLGALLANSVSNASEFFVGELIARGSGCPKGSAQQSFDQNSGELVLNFEQFEVDGIRSLKRIERKSCVAVLPMQMPEHLSVALVAAPTGTHEVALGGRASVQHEEFFAGSRGEVQVLQLFEPGFGEFNEGSFPVSAEPRWSPCGSSVNLRVNLSAHTLGSARVRVDSLRIKLLFRMCEN